ncbi:hypothetical protein [Dyadobacter psychrotolerans]|uniref:Uncharacterized protein n=1 Tax=Dyadobacter psychrotolerans TaxID=2541721 RepID=A0A4R5DR46_9BACT|nr:hypothetical protein [Dyadobacter psychrotolerans]TDE14754.1 hypothetical protein E0F88_16340 [Dyadobacter psychrotolerans]
MYIDSPWTTYAAVLSPLTLGYYIFISYKFYRQDLRSVFSGKQNRPVKKPPRPAPSISVIEQQSEPGHVEQETTEATLPDEETFQNVMALTAHLRDAIEEAHEKQYSKNDLVLLIQMLLKDYSYLKDTPFRVSINNQIEAECAKYGSMLLSEDETEELWI